MMDVFLQLGIWLHTPSSFRLLSIVSFEVRTNYRLPSRLSFLGDRNWSSNSVDDDDNCDDDGGCNDVDDEPRNLSIVRSTEVNNRVSAPSRDMTL
jgi:hypothetical protein